MIIFGFSWFCASPEPYYAAAERILVLGFCFVMVMPELDSDIGTNIG